MTYEMKISSSFQLPEKELVDISCAPWGGAYQPRCSWQGRFVKNSGFLLDLICWEKDPLRRYTKWQDPVYTDSCLEFFCNFDPENSDRYINFEMNANGAALVGVGKDRYDRTPLATAVMPQVRAAIMDEFWDVVLYVPVETVWEVYGRKIDFAPGYEMRANVQKCGSETAVNHWLCWNKIESPKPDFHRPESFGTILLVE